MLPKIDEGLTTLDCGRSFEQIASMFSCDCLSVVVVSSGQQDL